MRDINTMIQVVDHLTTFFKTNEDSEKLNDLYKIQCSNYTESSRHCAELMDVVKSVTRQVRKLEEDISTYKSKKYDVRKDEFNAQNEKMINSINRMKKKIIAYKKQIKELGTELKEIKQQIHQLENSKGYQLRMLVYSQNLYKIITNITWNENESSKISGVIWKKTESRSFEFDIETHTSFELTNLLWDLIDSQNVEKAS
ncbi:uncharacterized protein LOC126329067 [Schistocerca gregaria]|uniref:uncharacterized protein LOC126329067 n=1 Tax=Schistocerca gregaria TaxID=7010 RepID=UPI00211E087F|nr:uncharacterized protein LOC126329067 [Schistocerca gregaria]